MVQQALSYDTPLGHKALDCFSVKDFATDKAKASATAVFAAASKDRCGDLLEIAGIKVENHKKNPVVLWLHGYSWGGAEKDFPIGKAEDDGGNYTVSLLPDQGIAVATTYFSQKTLLAAQICELVMEGTIRGCSIGYREIKVERMYENDVYIGTHLLEVELIEYSWVPIPMNQDAVRACLSRDLVAGKSLAPQLKQSLIPFAGRAPVWATGFTPEVKTMAPITPAQPTKTKADEEQKPAEEPKKDGDQEEAVTEPHGATTIRGLHERMMGMLAFCKEMAGPLENETVKEIVSDLTESTTDGVMALEGCFKDLYPDLEGPKSGLKVEGDEEEKPEEEAKDDDDMDDEEAKRYLDEIEAQNAHDERVLTRHGVTID